MFEYLLRWEYPTSLALFVLLIILCAQYGNQWLDMVTTSFTILFTSSEEGPHSLKKLYIANPREKLIRTSSTRPSFVIIDPNLIKDVLMDDFECFTDREHKTDSLELFDLEGEVWRTVKNKLSDVYEDKNLRQMFDSFSTNLETLVTRISQLPEENVDLSKPLQNCVVDICSLAVFGFPFTIGTRKDEFTNHALSVFEKKPFRFLNTLSKEALKYFKKLVQQKFKSEKKNGGSNFVNLLRDLRKTSTESNNGSENKDCFSTFAKQTDVELTDEILTAQILQFLTSGLEPIVGAVTFALYDLSKASPDIQGRIKTEVTSCIRRNSGFNYDAVSEMSFLDKSIQESLRLHPVVHTATRICGKDYYNRKNNIHIPRHSLCIVPILAVHLDENRFPLPENFDPDRFSRPEESWRFMPFGRGPRKCVGEGFSLLAIKVILAKLIQQFTFRLSQKSEKTDCHKVRGPYIVPDEITFDIVRSENITLLS